MKATLHTRRSHSDLPGTPFPLSRCDNIVNGGGISLNPFSIPSALLLSSLIFVPPILHSSHSLPGSPGQRTIFSDGAAILEFGADWLLLDVWAAISSGMSGLLSNHYRAAAQGGRPGALITDPSSVLLCPLSPPEQSYRPRRKERRKCR